MGPQPTPDQAYRQALAYFQTGDLDRAGGICQSLLETMPGNQKLIHFHGLILFRQQRLPEAAQCIETAIGIDPAQPIYHDNLGHVYRAMGRFRQAMAAYEAAVRIKPDYAPGYNNIGLVLLKLGRPDQAARYFEKAVKADAGYFQALNNLAEIYKARGNRQKALSLFQAALASGPDAGILHYNIGTLHCDDKHFDRAIPYFEKAVSLKFQDKKIFNNYGACLGKLNRFEQACHFLEKALEMDPGYADAHNNLAEVHMAQCELGPALDRLETAIQLDPDHATAKFNRSLVMLTRGDFTAGWPGYGWRWEKENTPKPDYGLPQWDGTGLNGDVILVYDEQGVGDTIQFLRYLPLVKKAGARILFKTKPSLSRLFRQCRFIDRLWTTGTDTGKPDARYQIPLMDLPGLFRTTAKTIPRDIPYLEADHALITGWKRTIPGTGGLKVGIVWAGNPGHENDRNRSCGLDPFLGLAAIPGIRFFSLQKEITRDDATDLDAHGIVDIGTGFSDFADTAAALSLLDLVISVDTSVAHLSGALGRPTWTLLPFSPDWRWMLDRRDSPWYPAMTLFRQPGTGDWDAVFAGVADALTSALAGARS